MRAAGEYTERVEVLEPTIGRTESMRAQRVTYATKWPDVRARVVFMRGVSAITQTEAWQNRTITVMIRLSKSREVIDENWRIRWEGRTYQIDSLNRDRRGREIVMVCNSTDEGR